MITLQRLRSMILLSKLFRKTNLVTLEAANTTYAPILTQITQKYTDIDVCKNFFQAPFCALFSFFIFPSSAHTSINFPLFLFYFWGQIHINTNRQQKQQHINKQCMIEKQFNSQFETTLHQKIYALVAIHQLINQPRHYDAFFQYRYVDAVQGDGVARVTSTVQIQTYSKMKQTPHHSQPSKLYMPSPIHLEFSRIPGLQLTPRDYNQTVKFYHKTSQSTPNTTK